MKKWDERPREIRTLFNPAFCGLVLVRAIEGFTAEANRPMPFSLTLLILPLSLHQRTRNIFKQNNRSYLTSILQEHPEIRVGLAQRTRGLFPYTMEAFAYLAAYDVITVDENGGISVCDNRVRKSVSGSDETKDCQTVARTLGGKFSRINDRATIYTTLGIRP